MGHNAPKGTRPRAGLCPVPAAAPGIFAFLVRPTARCDRNLQNRTKRPTARRRRLQGCRAAGQGRAAASGEVHKQELATALIANRSVASVIGEGQAAWLYETSQWRGPRNESKPPRINPSGHATCWTRPKRSKRCAATSLFRQPIFPTSLTGRESGHQLSSKFPAVMVVDVFEARLIFRVSRLN